MECDTIRTRKGKEKKGLEGMQRKCKSCEWFKRCAASGDAAADDAACKDWEKRESPSDEEISEARRYAAGCARHVREGVRRECGRLRAVRIAQDDLDVLRATAAARGVSMARVLHDMILAMGRGAAGV